MSTCTAAGSVFKGRVSGFTMGTGSTLALLPAENATGNFIKVVQRLPVRIDLEGYDPDKNPLFIGTSVVPYVYIDKPPTGPDAGKFLADACARGANRRFDRERAGREQVTVAALSPAGPRAAVNPWLVAAVVVVPTFMEVLDTTIALVALRYIAGGLSATVDDGEWVITSYLAANAVILPITGWLSAHLGRRNYFLASIAIFTLSSLMCGLAGSLGQLILFRVIQGLAGGGLQPSSQGVLLDAFPAGKARRGDDAVRLRCLDRADRRPDPGRLDNGLLLVALGLFDQRAGRSPGARRMLCPASRPGLSRRPARGVAEAAVPL